MVTVLWLVENIFFFLPFLKWRDEQQNHLSSVTSNPSAPCYFVNPQHLSVILPTLKGFMLGFPISCICYHTIHNTQPCFYKCNQVKISNTIKIISLLLGPDLYRKVILHLFEDQYQAISGRIRFLLCI